MDQDPGRAESTGQSVQLQGRIDLFGYSSTEAALEALPRSLAWRGARALAFGGGGLVLAPVVGVIPPHAPWVVVALGLGGFFGLRKWRERFTILTLQGACPRCGGKLSIPGGTPLRVVMSLPCEGCHHDSRMELFLPSSGPPGH
ncbi:hypothetical protein ACFL5A_04530 [Gemmatimonadota bacterium]